MDDDKIKDIFQDFRPELSSDTLFISRLKRNMESVELVKRQTEKLHRHNKIAMAVAALTGFIMGVGMNLLFQTVGDWFRSIHFSIPSLGVAPLAFDGWILAWIATGIVSALTAVNAYAITVSRLSARESF